MKILSVALLLMASMAFVLLGCSDSSSPIAGPSDQAVGTAASVTSLGKGGILHSATGSVHWRYVPAVGTTNSQHSFSAIQHADGTVSGELLMKDKGHVIYGKAIVYGLKVSGNTAKLAFNFVSGDVGTFFPTHPEPTDIYGWALVIDNGEGSEIANRDYAGLILFTDGSDILDKTITDVDNMDIPTFLDWMRNELLPSYGLPFDLWLAPVDHGNVQVR